MSIYGGLADWPPHVDVVGEFCLAGANAAPYSPAPQLSEFLSVGETPVYMGFGSMVIEDSRNLINVIKAAAKSIGCRVLLQSGWTKYAEDYEIISEEVMVIGAMPHDWLFRQVSGVIHHGGNLTFYTASSPYELCVLHFSLFCGTLVSALKSKVIFQ